MHLRKFVNFLEISRTPLKETMVFQNKLTLRRFIENHKYRLQNSMKSYINFINMTKDTYYSGKICYSICN